MSNFEYFPINWVEGMHINASHFINTENFLLERILKVTSITFSRQYGILPDSNLSYSNIKIEKIGNKLSIHLKRYNGMKKIILIYALHLTTKKEKRIKFGILY